ncbi:MAG: hypothetical protein ACC655_08045 [Rhodothermia bacterium]
MIVDRIRRSRAIFGLVAGLALCLGDVFAATSFDQGLIDADRVIENLDSSKTFIRPVVIGESGRLGVRQGAPGACRLFGMDDFLRGQVIWSTARRDGASISDQGVVSDIKPGFYIESITCIAAEPYIPKITVDAIHENADGSVTVDMPEIHSGAEHYRIVSGFAAGACRLLGYNTAIQYSLVWSTQKAAGVSLAYDGQIYSKASGTYLTGLSCKNKPTKNFASPARALFDQRIREWREQS